MRQNELALRQLRAQLLREFDEPVLRATIALVHRFEVLWHPKPVVTFPATIVTTCDDRTS